VIEALREWLESIRAWLLARGEFGWLHGWIVDAPVSVIWIFVLLVIVAMILVVGFWPPLKPLETDTPHDIGANGEPRLTP
jgi:hypothetical protein